MLINTAALSALFNGFKANFNTGFRGAAPQWAAVATLVRSNNEQEQYAWLGQFPRLREWIGDRHVKGMRTHTYTIVNKPWESTIEVDKHKIQDDSFGIFAPLFAEMGWAAATHADEKVFELMDIGDVELGYDKVAFFSALHPHAIDGTNDNFLAPGGASAASPWYLLNTKRPLKPFIYQVREDAKLDSMQDPKDDPVWRRRMFEYGIEMRMNVGFGFWQQAIRSEDTLALAGFRTARTTMSDFRSDEGRPLNLRPDLMVVGTANEGAARDTILAERSASGATNTEQNAVDIMVVNWLP